MKHTPDPATEAVAFHLAALRELFAPEHQSATDKASGRLSQRVRKALQDQTTDAAFDHLFEAVHALAERVERIAQWHADDHEAVGDLQGETLRIATAIDAADEVARAHASDLAALRTSVDVGHIDLRRIRSRIERAQVATAGATPGDDTAPTSPPPDAASSSTLSVQALDDFYEDLETRFRGSREHVTGLVKVYLDDVKECGGPVLDIGCGRGEWLELLGENGIEAYGVDLNESFSQANRDRGLDVRTGDAIAHLAALAPNSLGVITGFHLAEHLPFPVLIELADRAVEALRPGGLLILESPNPTNVRVGAAQFWIDPTHIRPLHPELLRFVLQQRGFARADIRPLHPAAFYDTDWAAALGLAATDEGTALLDELREALTGPMDYAVIGVAGSSILD